MPTDDPAPGPPRAARPPSPRDRADPRTPPAPEVRERDAAWRRGEAHERARAGGQPTVRDASLGRARAADAVHAFTTLAENVRDYAIFLLDPAGVITFWGEGARLIKWWTKAQAEGAHLRLLYLPGGSEDGTAEDHLREATDRGESVSEGQRVRSDGSTFWAGVTLTALRDDDGVLLGFAKVTRDLTAQRAADALLQAAATEAERARAAAEAANTAKSGFLAMMSHEIRTPINAILGYHELLDLELDDPLTPGQRRHLARAGAAGRHLLTLVNQVLDFARVEADSVAVTPAAVRVGDAVAAALGLIAPDAQARGIALADAVSGSAAGGVAWGDEPRVRQILINLLANAVKFTQPRAGEPGRITVSAGTATRPSPAAQVSGEGPWVYVRVEDTGTGIAADRLAAVFEPFVQADMSLTRAHGGTGLGLAISRGLARRMGGDVTARSEVGIGSAFFLWLPAAPVQSLPSGGPDGYTSGGDAPAPVASLREIATAVLAEIEPVLRAYVLRLKSDPATPSAHAVAESDIENHLASFLADFAGTLTAMDGSGSEGTSGAGDAVRDGTAIQRTIAERHGTQRARLGWAEGEVRREFTVLKEELAAAIRRRAPTHLRGPTPEARQGETARALALLDQFLAIAEHLSVESHHRVMAG